MFDLVSFLYLVCLLLQFIRHCVLIMYNLFGLFTWNKYLRVFCTVSKQIIVFLVWPACLSVCLNLNVVSVYKYKEYVQGRIAWWRGRVNCAFMIKDQELWGKECPSICVEGKIFSCHSLGRFREKLHFIYLNCWHQN